MKIKKGITKSVQEATANLRQALLVATVDLMKQLGADTCDDVKFNNLLMMTVTKSAGDTAMTIKSQTMLADTISYNDSDGKQLYYLLEYNGEPGFSSLFLTIEQMMAVYEAVREVVKSE